jgi:hypothetical protein
VQQIHVEVLNLKCGGLCPACEPVPVVTQMGDYRVASMTVSSLATVPVLRKPGLLGL